MNTHDPIIGRYVYVQCEGKTYRTYYEEAGEGIPMVCLHTAGADAREYRHQLSDPAYTDHFRMIAFDLPWHGKSNPPEDFFEAEDEYKLTAKFYTDFVVAFCRALELEKPVVMGQSMGGNACIELALRHENEFSAFIALEGCAYNPDWWIDQLNHPHIHCAELISTFMYGLTAPESPEKYRHETTWYYAQGGPGVFKGDLYFYCRDSDNREKLHKISGRVPMYFLTGTYDYACTPEMTQSAAEKIKNAEVTIFDGGHFPTSEDPEKFLEVVAPVLRNIVQNDPQKRGGTPPRGLPSSGLKDRSAPADTGRRVIEL